MKSKTIFTVIFTVAASTSLLQMGMLGNGIVKTVADSVLPSVTIALPTKFPFTHKIVRPGFSPERIVIDDINVELLVFSVPKINDSWELLPHVANYAQQTSLINAKTGNVGLFADDRLDGFTRIDELLTGNDIIVYGKDQKAIYRVVLSETISSDIPVFEDTKEPMLTLIICEGSLADKRYMVRAKLIKIEDINI